MNISNPIYIYIIIGFRLCGINLWIELPITGHNTIIITKSVINYDETIIVNTNEP